MSFSLVLRYYLPDMCIENIIIKIIVFKITDLNIYDDFALLRFAHLAYPFFFIKTTSILYYMHVVNRTAGFLCRFDRFIILSI